MVFSPSQDAKEEGDEEGDVVTASAREGEGCSVLLQLYSLWRRWETAWEVLAPCWDLRCHLPRHHYCCQTGVGKDLLGWLIFWSDISQQQEEIFFPYKRIPVCILRVEYDWDDKRGGGNPINCGWCLGSEALTFPLCLYL